MTSGAFQGHVALVTGAGQGIGRAIALRLLQEGARVAAFGRTLEKMKGLAENADVDQARASIHAVDIRDRDAVSMAVAGIESDAGPIDHLVNAAGVLSPAPLLDADPQDIRDVIEINLIATLEVSRIVARTMVARGRGSIVTIGSNSATAARYGLGAYPASKAGVTHAMKCLGLELAVHNVRCNLVSPGSTDTPMQRGYQSDASSLAKVIDGDPSTYRLGIPLGRMADTDDVADAVLFLLSDRARHITMENLVIDGGATLGSR